MLPIRYFQDNPQRYFRLTTVMLCSFEIGDTDGDGLVDTFANDEELSISCGCSTSTSATSTSTVVPAPTASPVTPAPTPSAYGVCGEGGSISIASLSLPEVAGCLLSTDEVRNDITLYTTSGTDDVGQLWMYALDVTRDDSSAGVSARGKACMTKAMPWRSRLRRPFLSAQSHSRDLEPIQLQSLPAGDSSQGRGSTFWGKTFLTR